jgi:rhodanese-related sulfurtransferase
MRASPNQLLAALAVVCALGALVAGDVPQPGTEPDHSVSAVELAGWIREQRTGLQVLDLRGQPDFEQYHIPGARLGTVTSAAQLPSDSVALIVVYGETDEETRRVRARLERQQGAQVYQLQGGIGAWLADIMNPRPGESDSPEARQLYQRKRELADYFGGSASRFSEPTMTTEQLIKRMRRRTC